MNIQEIRQEYPQYGDLTDQELVDAFHQKYYADVPKDEFYKKIGLVSLTKTERAKDLGMSLSSGLSKGASYIAGLPGDIGELGKAYLPEFLTTPVGELITGKKQKEVPFFPTSKQVMDFAESKLPKIKPVTQYQPQTNLGRYAKTITEFATPGLLGKTKAAKSFGTKLGAGGGLFFQGTEDLTGSPTAASAVAIPAMLALSFLGGPSTAARLAERATKSVDADEIARAKNLEKLAQKSGIKLLPGEVFDDKFVQELTKRVVQSERGSPYVYEAIKGRGGATKRAAEQQAINLSKVPKSQREVFDLVQDVSTDAIKGAKIARTKTAQQAGYKISNTESLAPTQVFAVINKIDEAIESLPKTSPNIMKLNQIKNQLIKEKVKIKGVKEKQTIPETNINKLHSTFKQFRDDWSNSRKGIADETRFIDKQLGSKLFTQTDDGILDLLNQELRTNQSFVKATETFTKLSKELVDPIKRNVGALSKNGMTLSKIENFIFNPKNANTNDINKTLSVLNAVDPQATIQIANTYFRNALNNAFVLTKQGEDLTQGFNLVKSIVGTGKQRENFMAVLGNVAKAKNVNPQQLKVGFENMIRVLERTGRISSINKPGFDVRGLASKTIARDVALMKTFNPLVRLASKWSEIKGGGADAALGRIFASDEAVENIIMLAKTNPESKKAISRVVQIIDATQQVLPEELPEEIIYQ